MRRTLEYFLLILQDACKRKSLTLVHASRPAHVAIFAKVSSISRRGKGVATPNNQQVCSTNHERRPDKVLLSSPHGVSSLEELIWAASLSRHPTVANYFTVDLAVLKEMAQELAELFNLTLPVLFKRQAHKTAGYQLGPEPRFTTSPRGLVGSSS